MTFTICVVSYNAASSCVEVNLAKPLSGAGSESVIVRVRLPAIEGETQENLERRARQAAKKSLSEAILSI